VTPTSANFSFLSDQDPKLVQFGALAERYFSEDPSTSLFKVRQFAELLAKTVAAHHRAYQGERETFEETLRRLSFDRILPREVSEVFHRLRKLGNVAAHEGDGSYDVALSALNASLPPGRRSTICLSRGD
jgi:type I restriction enzyme R subunit